VALSSCIRHPDRMVELRTCATAIRDGLPPEQNVCACCEECVALCLATPHGHGSTPANEYDAVTGTCRICGEDITRWLPMSRWG
jgi:hypothetical protein